MPPGIPPQKALKRALHRHATALAALYADEIEIAGETYCAAISLGEVTREMHPDGSGWRTVQRLRADVSKQALETAPALQSVVRVNECDFRVMEVGGQDHTAAAWVINGLRVVAS